MISRLCAYVLPFLASAAVVAPLAAQETGLDALHTQRREAGKICMIDHFHYGSSTAMKTKKAAEVEAIRDWAGFTAWEYGDPWGRWTLAGSKKVECTGSGANWGCKVEARACKPARR